jgi:hypothetical protein
MVTPNKPAPEQLKRDSDHLKKLRGYCSKAVNTLEDLPNNHAYTILSCRLSPLALEIPSIEDCKYSLHRVWGIAYCMEAYIQHLGGPRRMPYKSKLSDEEIARRMGGEYCHTSIPRPRPCPFHFSEEEKKLLRQFMRKMDQEEFDLFITLTEETVTCYLRDKWEGKPNREDSLDKLNTLRRQVERVLGNTDRLLEMAAGRYLYSDCGFPENIKSHADNVRELLFAIEAATEKIKQLPRRSKPLEWEMVDEIAYRFWAQTGIKPSARNKFMGVIAVIDGTTNTTLGIELIESVVKKLPMPTPKTNKSAKPPQTS